MRKTALYLSVLVLVVAAGLFVVRSEIFYNDPDSLNVVLIGLDTLRADHTSCYGYEKKTTPRIDEAAAEGVRFASCTSQAPWTLPSFSTVFTSLHPSRHGAQINREFRNLTKDIPRKLKDVATLFAGLQGRQDLVEIGGIGLVLQMMTPDGEPGGIDFQSYAPHDHARAGLHLRLNRRL